MNRRCAGLIAVVFASASLASGCGGDDTSSAATASDVPETPACPAGAERNEEGGYCLTLPEGFGPQSSLSQGADERDYGYGSATGYLSVEVTNTTDDAVYERELALYAESDPRYLEHKSEDLPGGAKEISFVWSYDGQRQTVYFVRDDSKFIVCWARSADPDAPELSACRTLVLL